MPAHIRFRLSSRDIRRALTPCSPPLASSPNTLNAARPRARLPAHPGTQEAGKAMSGSRCVHGLDVRFCSLCDKQEPVRRAGSRPVSTDDPDLVEIVRFLNEEKVRATYGAVAYLIGGIAQGVGARLTRLYSMSPEASWVVNAETGLPTGYDQSQWHLDLLSKNSIIRTGSELEMRMSVWSRREESGRSR